MRTTSVSKTFKRKSLLQTTSIITEEGRLQQAVALAKNKPSIKINVGRKLNTVQPLNININKTVSNEFKSTPVKSAEKL